MPIILCENMNKKVCYLVACAAVACHVAMAGDIHVNTKDEVTGIDNIIEALPDCAVRTQDMPVAGVQYDNYGMTIDLIQFTQSDGSLTAIPTNFSKAGFSGLELGRVTSFIRLGKTYRVHYQLCGQGAYPDLLSINEVK